MEEIQKSFWKKTPSELTMQDQLKMAGVLSAVALVPTVLYVIAELALDPMKDRLRKRKAYKEFKKTALNKLESV
jgi:hypothetical protein